MTIAAIEALIAEAKAKRLWLHPIGKTGIYLHPDYVEKFIGAEKMASGDNYSRGWALIDAKEIAERHREHVV